MKPKKSVMKSQNLLEQFTVYCEANPNLRFWQ